MRTQGKNRRPGGGADLLFIELDAEWHRKRILLAFVQRATVVDHAAFEADLHVGGVQQFGLDAGVCQALEVGLLFCEVFHQPRKVKAHCAVAHFDASVQRPVIGQHQQQRDSHQHHQAFVQTQ